MTTEETITETKRFDLIPAALAILTGLALGACCAIFLDAGITNSASALSSIAPSVNGFAKTIAEALRACLAAVGVFWIRAYADDIYNKPTKRSAKVTLKKDSTALLLWTFFAALSVMMSAKIVTRGVELIIERYYERELFVVNNRDADRLPPSLTFTKVSWHFFFHEGKLCERPGCELKNAPHPDLKKICTPDNLAVHGKFKPGGNDKLDDRGRPLGTSFQDIDDKEIVKRLVSVIEVSARCARLEGTVRPAQSMLTLIPRTSNLDWEGCSNKLELDAALRLARAERIRALFEDARKIAPSAAEIDLRPYVEALSLNDPSKTEKIDFSDERYAAAHGAVGAKSETTTPFDITQSVAIVLQNPAGCQLNTDRSSDRMSPVVD